MGENREEQPCLPVVLLRAREFQAQGLDWIEATNRAQLEQHILNWPSDWGNTICFLIYGNFIRPASDIHIRSLGLTVHSERIEGSVIRSAECVLKATVEVGEKSLVALLNAIRRVNLYLGAWSLVDWSHGTCGWWCYLIEGPVGGGYSLGTLENNDLYGAIDGILQLNESVRKKVEAALYWIRGPKNPTLAFRHDDLLKTYVGYWNAFECLVDAIDLLVPQQKSSKSYKQQLLTDFFATLSSTPTLGDIEKCYRTIINPGLRGKASYALKQCFGAEAQAYIDECFEGTNQHDSLYQIRNAINHGDFDAENPEQRARLEAHLPRLWKIVWRMFGCIVPFPAPADSRLTLNCGTAD
jgi:hypothetical protein